jgi:hypothetical protein
MLFGISSPAQGWVAERLKAPVLKTGASNSRADGFLNAIGRIKPQRDADALHPG